MAFHFKRGDPIDRAIHDLDHQIATLQRQARELTNGPANAGASPRSKAQALTRFVKEMLGSPNRTGSPPQHARRDLFDVQAEPLKELEAGPIAFAQKPSPDLFAPPPAPGHPASTGLRRAEAPTSGVGAQAGTGALESAQVVPPKDKLAHYLGAGSIKSYKPLKRAQRQTRNRFFMWLGLSFVALWIIWFVIR